MLFSDKTMTEENLFPLFHAYNKLVRRGLVKALACDCGNNFVTSIDKKTMIDDEVLILECYFCGTMMRPGETTISNVRAVVQEHFMDSD